MPFYAPEKKLCFTPLVKIDDILKGKPIDIIAYAKFTYIGDAQDMF